MQTDIPEHFIRFFDIAVKDLEYMNTLFTLVLGALAYLATKRILEAKEGGRRLPFALLFVPTLCAASGLVLSQWSYFQMENAFLTKRTTEFVSYWLWARSTLLALFVLAAVSLGAVFATLRRE